MNQFELNIEAAIAELASEPNKSIRAVAAAYNLSDRTLRRRLAGGTNKRTSHEQQQRLTPLQEQFLVDWILECDQHGYPPSHARTREMAFRILQLGGDNRPLGVIWVRNFVNRNPAVASAIGRKTEASRINCTTSTLTPCHSIGRTTSARHDESPALLRKQRDTDTSLL